MNWSNNWGDKPDVPEWVRPQLDKITEETKEASEWVKKVEPLSVGIDYGYDDKSFETLTQDKKVISQHEIKSIQLGNKTISVTVVGDLGLDFCEPGEKDEGWNIYHLPTLACFSSAVPPATVESNVTEGKWVKSFDYDKPELVNWMAKVQENYPTSWQVLRLLTPDTYKDNGETAKEIIQKWCLSVKVE